MGTGNPVSCDKDNGAPGEYDSKVSHVFALLFNNEEIFPFLYVSGLVEVAWAYT